MHNCLDRFPFLRHIAAASLVLQLAACGSAGVSTDSAGVPSSPSASPPSGSPSITISAPTTASSFVVASSSITIGGNASDGAAVTRVSWGNSLGGSGSQNVNAASVSWSFNIPLQPGTNVVTVTARNAAGQTNTDQITVTRTVSTNVAALSWDPNGESDVVGYRIYYGTTPGSYQQTRGAGIEVTGGTTYTVTGLSSGTRYYFVVTAFDGSGNESDNSREVSKDIP